MNSQAASIVLQKGFCNSHAQTMHMTIKPSLLYTSHVSIPYTYNNDINPHYKQIINAALHNKPNTIRTFYKETQFNSNSDLLRRYYDAQAYKNRKAELDDLYQFSVPKPKVYAKAYCKMHFRYYYLKRKLREELLRDALKQLSDNELHKLDVRYLETHTKQRSVLNEAPLAGTCVLNELGPTIFMPKQISFGLSLSIVSSEELESQHITCELIPECMGKPSPVYKAKPKPLRRVSGVLKDCNFKKAKFTSKMTPVKPHLKSQHFTNSTIRLSIHAASRQTINSSRSIYSSTMIQSDSSKLTLARKRMKLKVPTFGKQTNTKTSSKVICTDPASSSIIISAEARKEVPVKETSNRLSIFKAMNNPGNVLTQSKTPQAQKVNRRSTINKLTLQKLCSRPLKVVEIDTDRESEYFGSNLKNISNVQRRTRTSVQNMSKGSSFGRESSCATGMQKSVYFTGSRGSVQIERLTFLRKTVDGKRSEL